MKNRINVHLKKFLFLCMSLVLLMTICLSMSFLSSAEVSYTDPAGFSVAMDKVLADFKNHYPEGYDYIIFHSGVSNYPPSKSNMIVFSIVNTPYITVGSKCYMGLIQGNGDGTCTIEYSQNAIWIYDKLNSITSQTPYISFYDNSRKGSMSYRVIFGDMSTASLANYSTLYAQAKAYGTDSDGKFTNCVNSTALRALLSQAKALQKTGYADSSWNTLQSQITNAENLLATTNYTQTQIDNVKNALQSALYGLELQQLYVNIDVGATLKLSVTGDITNNSSFTWASSDESVATVNADGIVTGISFGLCKITAQDSSGFSQSISVKVEESADSEHAPSGTNTKNEDVNLADAVHRAGVEASSTWYMNEGYGPDKAVDNDVSTRWASADEAADPVSLTVKFKDLYTFNHVLIRSCTDRVTNYELQYLKQGTSDEWITFKSGGNLPDDQDVILDDFGEIVGSGIRLVMNRDKLAVSIYELQVKYK